MPQPRMTALLAGGAVLTLAAVLPAAPASAQTVRVGAGSTTIVLTPQTRAALGRLDMRVAAQAPATAGSRGVALPIARGRLAESGVGFIDHLGGLRFTGDGRTLRLSRLRVNLARTSSITASVSGRRAKVFTLAAADAKAGTEGAVAGITDLRVRLTTVGATALNRTAGRSAFRAGQTIGVATTEFLPATVRSTDGRTKLTPAAALGAAGATIAPVGPATAAGGGVLLPIVSSTTATRTGYGRAAHSGALAITAGGRTVQATALGYNLHDNSVLNATVNGQLVPLADLDLEKASFAFTPRRGRIEDVAATLTARSAAALNAALATTAFTAGQPLGTIDIEFTTTEE